MVSEERSSSTTQRREGLPGVVPRHPSTGAGKAAENPSIQTIESFEETHANGDDLRSAGATRVVRHDQPSRRHPWSPRFGGCSDGAPTRLADVRGREAGRLLSVQSLAAGGVSRDEPPPVREGRSLLTLRTTRGRWRVTTLSGDTARRTPPRDCRSTALLLVSLAPILARTGDARRGVRYSAGRADGAKLRHPSVRNRRRSVRTGLHLAAQG